MHPWRGFSKNNNLTWIKETQDRSGCKNSRMSSYPWCTDSVLTLPNTALLGHTRPEMLQVFVNQRWITVPFQRQRWAAKISGIASLIFRKKDLRSITLVVRRQGRKNMAVATPTASASKGFIAGADTASSSSGAGRGQAWPHRTGRRRAAFKSKRGESCPLYLPRAVVCLDHHTLVPKLHFYSDNNEEKQLQT